MHDYSIDKHPKEKIIFWLAFLAVLSTPLIQDLLDKVINGTGLYEGFVVVLPVITVFTGLYALFNLYLWKLGWLRRFLLIPDLNGAWKCQGKTLYKNGAPADFEWSGLIEITQSWSKISIAFKGENSSSKSVSASLYEEKGTGYRLLYQYQNCPEVSQSELNIHLGSAELLFNQDCSKAQGNYYTDRHRSTVGSMNLTKQRNSK